MTADQRAEAERKRAELVAALSADGPADARGTVLAKMVMAYPMAGGAGEAVAQARGEAYLDAVGDMPAWAIREAVRLWNRHGCGDHNYSFAPAPGVLRAITDGVLAPYRRALDRVETALNAVTIDRALDPTPIERGKSLVPNLRVMK